MVEYDRIKAPSPSLKKGNLDLKNPSPYYSLFKQNTSDLLRTRFENNKLIQVLLKLHEYCTFSMLVFV